MGVGEGAGEGDVGRAEVQGTAVTIDNDYFSRHGGGMSPLFFLPGPTVHAPGRLVVNAQRQMAVSAAQARQVELVQMAVWLAQPRAQVGVVAGTSHCRRPGTNHTRTPSKPPRIPVALL